MKKTIHLFLVLMTVILFTGCARYYLYDDLTNKNLDNMNIVEKIPYNFSVNGNWWQKTGFSGQVMNEHQNYISENIEDAFKNTGLFQRTTASSKSKGLYFEISLDILNEQGKAFWENGISGIIIFPYNVAAALSLTTLPIIQINSRTFIMKISVYNDGRYLSNYYYTNGSNRVNTYLPIWFVFAKSVDDNSRILISRLVSNLTYSMNQDKLFDKIVIK